MLKQSAIRDGNLSVFLALRRVIKREWRRCGKFLVYRIATATKIGLKGANDARQFCGLDLIGAAVMPARTYSGSFFHPVSIDIKLFIPWIATITRCPRTKTPSIKRLAKCHMRARWN